MTNFFAVQVLLLFLSVNLGVGFLGGGCGMSFPPPQPWFQPPCPQRPYLPPPPPPIPPPQHPCPQLPPIFPAPQPFPCPLPAAPVLPQPCPLPLPPPPQPLQLPQPCPLPPPQPFPQPPCPLPQNRPPCRILPQYYQQYQLQQQYNQHYQQPSRSGHHLPPLIPTPRVFPEIPPEEEFLNNNKIIKETVIKKKFPDPFDDEKLPSPVPIPDRRPQTGAGGCGGDGPYPHPIPYPYGTPYAPYRELYLRQQQQQLQREYEQLQRQEYFQTIQHKGPYPREPPFIPAGGGHGLQPPHSHHIPPPPLFSSCCTRCGCMARAAGQKTANSTEPEKETNEVVQDVEVKELACNNDKLKSIMELNKNMPLKEAKLLIHEAAEKELGPLFQVVCAEFDFEYVTRAAISCQVEMDNGICYAFQTG